MRSGRWSAVIQSGLIALTIPSSWACVASQPRGAALAWAVAVPAAPPGHAAPREAAAPQESLPGPK